MFESATPRRTFTPGFVCALIGLGMTVLARVGPWTWPGWPAVTLLDLYLARAAPSVLPPHLKAIGLVVLLVVNAGFWALIFWLIIRATTALRRRR